MIHFKEMKSQPALKKASLPTVRDHSGWLNHCRRCRKASLQMYFGGGGVDALQITLAIRDPSKLAPTQKKQPQLLSVFCSHLAFRNIGHVLFSQPGPFAKPQSNTISSWRPDYPVHPSLGSQGVFPPSIRHL